MRSKHRKAWEPRGKIVAYKGRPAVITRIHRDGTYCLTFVDEDDGRSDRVVYHVPPNSLK